MRPRPAQNRPALLSRRNLSREKSTYSRLYAAEPTSRQCTSKSFSSFSHRKLIFHFRNNSARAFLIGMFSRVGSAALPIVFSRRRKKRKQLCTAFRLRNRKGLQLAGEKQSTTSKLRLICRIRPSALSTSTFPRARTKRTRSSSTSNAQLSSHARPRLGDRSRKFRKQSCVDGLEPAVEPLFPRRAAR